MGLVNTLLIRWGGSNATGGQIEVSDSTSVTAYGRREALIPAGNVTDIETVVKIATDNLAVTKDPVKSITAQMNDLDPADGYSAYTSYSVGDTLTVPDFPSGTLAARCVAVTVTEDHDAYLTVTPEFVSLRDVMLQRLNRFMNRTNGGLLNGRSPSASIVTLNTPSATAQMESETSVGFHTSGNAVVAVGDKSAPDRSPVGECIFYRVVIDANGYAGTTTTTFTFAINGTTVCTVSLAGSSAETIYDLTGAETALVGPGDLWVATCTVAGGHSGIAIRCLVASVEQ